MVSRKTLLAGLLGLGGRLLLAQVPPEERIPITDPDRLERMGFPRDAKNVYVWSKADLGGSQAKDSANVETPETWGTQAGFTSISPAQFVAFRPDYTDLEASLSLSCLDDSSFSDCCGGGAFAQIDVPNGARLEQFLFWAYDSHADFDLPIRIHETCQANGAVPPTLTVIAEVQTFLAIGQYFGFASLNDLTVDNKSCTYHVVVQLKPGFEECVGPSLEFQKLRVNWYRQVSPAPATATFNDVPTSHPFFQFVEALAKSGITSGCGGGNYCPDSPLTRGQMAVFLAKALGLQWP